MTARPSTSPLPFRGGDGGGACSQALELVERPHPNPASGRSGSQPDLNRAGRGSPDAPEGERLREGRTRRDSGFALVEVVIAAAIIAGMMGLTYQTIAANAQAAHMVRDRRAAVLLAQSVLDQATAAPDAANLVRSGRADGLVWTVTTGGYRDGRASGPPVEEIAVEVRDEGSAAPLLTLRTLRLAR